MSSDSMGGSDDPILKTTMNLRVGSGGVLQLHVLMMCRFEYGGCNALMRSQLDTNSLISHLLIYPVFQPFKFSRDSVLPN
ncbi:hypothetical protein HRE53_32720 (plasmid) [Acaryochloris sp. 'Moss Beach']|uniref:hypothetical protein n=1 Tax=Acaryochloris sp. 'Moss Beach' TaxID=2740837 RepID=UPI001F1B6CD2|nr:hypothetical protein [Acaryochloris sp. 'Moss Beach']UJB73399.1 hypothetical protein HRE53_32720 [Acaryochloris sp. 'Moss Beach']